MPTYRIYPLNGGRLSAGYDHDCNDDAEAMIVAGRMMRGAKQAEIWQGIRLVGLAGALADIQDASSVASLHLLQQSSDPIVAG